MARGRSELDIVLNLDDNASGALDNVNQSLDDLDESASNAGGALDSFGGIAAGAATAGVLALGAAVVATAAHAINLAGQVEEAGTKMTTQLGLSAQEAGEFEKTMRDIFRNNFGESYEDIAQSLADVNVQFERIGGLENQAALQAITEDALAIRDAFGVDVQESMNAVVTLMEQFGLTSTEATDFLVAGFQEGLDASGDFLESIGEYSVQFSEGGATAGQFFNVLEEGIAGGVLGTDKIADAFKEFRIRLVDDSDTTKEAFETIGISYEELAEGFADGSITAIDAVQDVVTKIMEIEDPIERNIVGTLLFGTQWEDSGEKVISSLGDIEDKLGDTAGATESLDEQYQTAANEWETATRQWNDALVEVGELLSDITVKILPGAIRVLQNFAEITRDILEGLGLIEAKATDPAFTAPGTEDSFLNRASPAPIQGIINPANIRGPNDPPLGWVGAWPPGAGTGAGTSVVQNFYGSVGQSENALAELAGAMGMVP